MKNVLVSKEKWTYLLGLAGIARSYGDIAAEAILSMPDFVESDEDIKGIAASIHSCEVATWTGDGVLTQADADACKTLADYEREYPREHHEDSTGYYVDTVMNYAQTAINTMRGVEK